MAVSSPAVLDRALALERVDGDLELLREIAVLFLENLPLWLGELRDAAARHDLQTLSHSAHGLKGSIANFGAHPAFQAALTLEMIGRNQSGASPTEVHAALLALESTLEALTPELKAL